MLGLTTLLVASTGGHLKQLHRLHRRLTASRARSAGRRSTRRRAARCWPARTVDFVPFVGGRDPRNVLRNVPLRAPDPARAARSTRSCQHRLRHRAAVLRARPRARAGSCHYIESAARSDGPSMTGALIARIPGVNLLRAVPGVGGRALAVPRLGLRLASRAATSRWPRPRDPQGRRLARDVQGLSASSASSRRLLEILPPGRRGALADRRHRRQRPRHRGPPRDP